MLRGVDWLIVIDVSKYCCASNCNVQQSKKNGLELFDPEGVGSISLRNFHNYIPDDMA